MQDQKTYAYYAFLHEWCCAQTLSIKGTDNQCKLLCKGNVL